MDTNKKLQSALELLTTYSLMVLMVSILLVVLFYITYPTTGVIPNQCHSYGSLTCYEVDAYTNTLASINSANVVFYFTDSSSAPVNVISTYVVINGQTATGTCSNNLNYASGNTLVDPGEATMCHATFVPAFQLGRQLSGQFNVTMTECNSGPSQLDALTCTMIPIKLTGAFIVYPVPIVYNNIYNTHGSCKGFSLQMPLASNSVSGTCTWAGGLLTSSLNQGQFPDVLINIYQIDASGNDDHQYHFNDEGNFNPCWTDVDSYYVPPGTYEVVLSVAPSNQHHHQPTESCQTSTATEALS